MHTPATHLRDRVQKSARGKNRTSQLRSEGEEELTGGGGRVATSLNRLVCWAGKRARSFHLLRVEGEKEEEGQKRGEGEKSLLRGPNLRASSQNF